MTIRTAALSDLEAIATLESLCFPAAEAASKKAIFERLQVFPTHFWLLEDGNNLVSFINGMVTNESTIRDEMFQQPDLHDEKGDWQAIFGVCTDPEHQGRGYAAQLMERVIADSKIQGRKGCILTCKQKLIHYYERFGYKNAGLSISAHGGAEWYDMRLEIQR